MADATDLERLVVQMSVDIRQLQRGLDQALGVTNRQARAIEKRAQQMTKTFDGVGRGIANSLTGPLAGIGAALGIKEIADYADAWTIAGNKIRAAATSNDVQVRSLDALKDGANSARTGLTEYTDLYAKLIRSASGVAKNEEEIALATNVVSKAFKAGGASAQEQAAGILQLGQALGSGVLQGDELRSVRENAPVVAKAIADEMGVSIAALKDLGAEGKITSDIVFRALLNSQQEVEKQFRATTATIKDALTVVNNEFTAYIGNANNASGASASLVSALLTLADNFKGVADAVVVFATVVVGALTGRAIGGMIVGLGNAVVALGAFLTALRTGTVVAGTFTAALGPIGLLAGAAAAALLLLTSRVERTDQAAEQHTRGMQALKDAYAAVQRGAKGAETQFKKTGDAQLEAGEKALKAAEDILKARQAVADAGENGLTAFGESPLAAGQQGYNRQAVDDALADLKKRQTELEETRRAIANPSTLTTDDNFGNGPGYTPPPKPVKRTAESRFNADIQSVKDRIAALDQERQALGLTTAEQAKRQMALQLEQQALADMREEARRKGETDLDSIKLSEEQRQRIDEVATAWGRAADQMEQARLAQDRFNQAQQELGDYAVDLATNWTSVNDALQDGLKLLALWVAKAAILGEGPLGGIFGAGATSSGPGGLIGALFGGFRANGGDVQPGRSYVVGENGPERFVPSTKGTIIPNVPNQTEGASITFAPVTTIDARGSQMGEGQLRAILDQNNRKLLQQVPAVVERSRSRSPRGTRT